MLLWAMYYENTGKVVVWHKMNLQNYVASAEHIMAALNAENIAPQSKGAKKYPQL